MLFISRSVRVVIGPVRDQYLNDRVENVGQATILSGASMVLSVTAGGANLIGGWLATGVVQFLTGSISRPDDRNRSRHGLTTRTILRVNNVHFFYEFTR